jgi:hypothetical protein
MKQKDFFNIGLPKWPALVVVGDPVSREQAMEILIRTDSLRLSSNDREFDKQLNEHLYQIKIDTPGYDSAEIAIRKKLGLGDDKWVEVFHYQEERRKELNWIPLEYLNNSRIVSSWIGGPHGWCDWSGNIGTRNYNIGKWPSVETVFNEWKLIAEAFPFLNLRCQLMADEAEESEVDRPLIEFAVKEGRVQMKVPKKPLTKTSFGNPTMYENLYAMGRERGCTIETFKKAVDFVKSKTPIVTA